MTIATRRPRKPGCNLAAGALALALGLFAGPAAAAGAAIIWPTDPVLATKARAVALRLQNEDRLAQTYQIRIFRWRQIDNANDYTRQHELLASPPITRIAPSQRQLFRLTRVGGELAERRETAYRIIVDQLPDPLGDGSTGPTNDDSRAGPDNDAAGVGVRGSSVSLRMRYSIPLFVYTGGLVPANDRSAHTSRSARRHLHWWVSQDHGRAVLRIANDADRHVRLTDVVVRSAAGRSASNGLYGYVLAHSTREWPLKMTNVAELRASINGAPAKALSHRDR